LLPFGIAADLHVAAWLRAEVWLDVVQQDELEKPVCATHGRAATLRMLDERIDADCLWDKAGDDLQRLDGVQVLVEPPLQKRRVNFSNGQNAFAALIASLTTSNFKDEDTSSDWSRSLGISNACRTESKFSLRCGSVVIEPKTC
jgi:hypothetical protein